MHVVIFDDDLVFANSLLKKFEGYFEKLIESIEIVSTDFSLDIHKNIDIAFVDIDLEGKNGIALAKYIKRTSSKTLIIFVSSKEELVFNALSVSTFQFIRKSKFREDCFRILKQLYQYIQEQEKK